MDPFQNGVKCAMCVGPSPGAIPGSVQLESSPARGRNRAPLWPGLLLTKASCLFLSLSSWCSARAPPAAKAGGGVDWPLSLQLAQAGAACPFPLLGTRPSLEFPETPARGAGTTLAGGGLPFQAERRWKLLIRVKSDPLERDTNSPASRQLVGSLGSLLAHHPGCHKASSLFWPLGAVSVR